jgi:hypothetical protein
MRITDWSAADAKTGSQAVGVSSVQLLATARPCSHGVFVKAAPTNSGIVYIGRSSAVTASSAAPTTDGYPLSAGEELPVLVDDVSKIWCIASVAAQAVNFLAQ